MPSLAACTCFSNTVSSMLASDAISGSVIPSCWTELDEAMYPMTMYLYKWNKCDNK